MSVFMICERIVSFIAGNRLELSGSHRAMLEALDYEGLTADFAQSEAVTVARHFAFVRDGLLSAYPWVFARKSAALPELVSCQMGWRFAYAAPADCLRILELLSMGKSIPTYEIIGNAVTCDYSDVTARYTARVDDVNLWPPMFVDAFCFRMAREICGVVSGSAGAAQMFGQNEETTIQEAYRLGIIDEGPRVEAHQYGWDKYSEGLL